MSAPFLPTPSSYPRLARCLGGAVVPGAQEVLPAMSRGTAIHLYLQLIGTGATSTEALAAVPVEWRNDCEAIPLKKLPRLTEGTPELGMAWSPETGACRVLGAGMSREEARAAARPDEVPMVADWAALVGHDSGVLCDWKTGWQETLAAAHENMQLLTYGAVYLLAQGLESVSLYLCRPDREKPYWDGPVMMDRLDAEAHLLRVAELLASVMRARQAYEKRRVLPELSVGPWCVWCPARRMCPAHVAAILAVLEGDAERAVENFVELTPAQAGNLWQQLKAAEKRAKELREHLEFFASMDALPLPDGSYLAEVPTVEEEPIPEKVHELLRVRFGLEVASAVVRPDTTWKRLEAVLEEKVLPQRKADYDAGRWQAGKPTKTGLLREVRQWLVGSGAVRLINRRTVKPVRPPVEPGGAPEPIET